MMPQRFQDLLDTEDHATYVVLPPRLLRWSLHLGLPGYAVFPTQGHDEGMQQPEMCSLMAALIGTVFLDGGDQAVHRVLSTILDWPEGFKKFKCDTDLFDIHPAASCHLAPFPGQKQNGWEKGLHLANHVYCVPAPAPAAGAAGAEAAPLPALQGALPAGAAFENAPAHEDAFGPAYLAYLGQHRNAAGPAHHEPANAAADADVVTIDADEGVPDPVMAPSAGPKTRDQTNPGGRVSYGELLGHDSDETDVEESC
ncbi:hypothetical protein WJX73_004340 [Symbiochloris irregularis]|uniref:RNase III domain-containing protein n=1 Tax=Symbiochloris irregularis TaxID=706552 RepID=A0AAW1NSQ1_9CHLO